jgi:UDP-N-acetylmuramoyl-tripeptide--D-alanyl-D-alanine ligase
MTAPLWVAAEAASAVGGTLLGTADWQARGVSIDTRTLVPGDLFVALKGPNHDGHDHVAAALKAGAVAALVHRVPDGLPADAALLLVADTLEGLADLGRFARMRSTAKVIALTGSVGKTTTKEMLALAFGAQGGTHASAGSLNNHWGVPLSLARLPAGAAFAVFEIGMNHAGEVAALTRMVQPDVSLITTVAAVHTEFFASVEAIADAKAEIFEGQQADGIAILPRDNAHYARLLAAARTRHVGRTVSFGVHEQADSLVQDILPDQRGALVSAHVLGQPVQFCLQLLGRHHAVNALAALTAVAVLGGDVAAAAAALEKLAPLKGRGLRHIVPLLGGGAFALIDESYNASPVSVAAALAVLGQTPGARRVAVLGDMRELGPQGPQMHAGLAVAAEDAGVDRVHCCGPLMHTLWQALPAPRRGLHAADSAALAPLVVGDVRDGDVLMVKGSWGSRMAVVVDALLQMPYRDSAEKNKTKQTQGAE